MRLYNIVACSTGDLKGPLGYIPHGLLHTPNQLAKG